VYCITKAAIKNVHFGTELSKVAALVATSTCSFSCSNSSSVETTAGNSVTKMMIESCLSTQRVWRKLVSASVAKKPNLKLLFQHCLKISIRAVQNATEKRICPI